MAFIIDDAILAAIVATGTTEAAAAGTAAATAAATTSAGAAAAGAGGLTLTELAAGASLASTAAGGYTSYRGARAGERANELQKRKQRVQAQRERRRTAREALIKAASIKSQAASQGVEVGSTGRIGAVAGVVSENDRNQSFLQTQQRTADQAGNFLNKAAGYEQASNFFGTVGGVADQFLRARQQGLFGS